MKQYLTTYLPRFKGRIVFHKRPYVSNDLDQFSKLAYQFIEKQYPSSCERINTGAKFRNRLIRTKVHRGQNFVRAFGAGDVYCELTGDQLTVTLSGNLNRGVAIAASRAVVMSILFYLVVPKLAALLGLAFFVLSYYLLVVLTKKAFPAALVHFIEAHSN